MSLERVAPPVFVADAIAGQEISTGAPPAQMQPDEFKSTLSLLQANLLVAMLGGFWARASDGHPGPDLMGRGLLVLNALVQWERINKERSHKNLPAKEARKPG